MTAPSRATVFRSSDGGPDVVYLHFDRLPSPTSTTKLGLNLQFKVTAGLAERYLIEHFELEPDKIRVRSLTSINVEQ